MTDVIKQKDQIAMLEAARDFTDGKEFPGMFSYPECGWDLVQQGLATEDRKITIAGRAALWFLDKGDDPTDSASSVTIEFGKKEEK